MNRGFREISNTKSSEYSRSDLEKLLQVVINLKSYFMENLNQNILGDKVLNEYYVPFTNVIASCSIGTDNIDDKERNIIYFNEIDRIKKTNTINELNQLYEKYTRNYYDSIPKTNKLFKETFSAIEDTMAEKERENYKK